MYRACVCKVVTREWIIVAWVRFVYFLDFNDNHNSSIWIFHLLTWDEISHKIRGKSFTLTVKYISLVVYPWNLVLVIYEILLIQLTFCFSIKPSKLRLQKGNSSCFKEQIKFYYSIIIPRSKKCDWGQIGSSDGELIRFRRIRYDFCMRVPREIIVLVMAFEQIHRNPFQ